MSILSLNPVGFISSYLDCSSLDDSLCLVRNLAGGGWIRHWRHWTLTGGPDLVALELVSSLETEDSSIGRDEHDE